MLRTKRIGIFLLLLLLAGCALVPTDEEKEKTKDPGTLLCEETISPNAEYVSSKEDEVDLTVKIYQQEDHTVTVEGTSNSPLIKEQSYCESLDQAISKEDITITWTTMMGNPVPSEDDQLMVADIVIQIDGQTISERKINFGNDAMEIITEAIDQNTK